MKTISNLLIVTYTLKSFFELTVNPNALDLIFFGAGLIFLLKPIIELVPARTK